MLTYGFYPSLNGDRKYNASQMNGIIDGIVGSGIFSEVGDAFEVTAYSGMTIHVGAGKAWFNSTWTENDSTMSLTLDDSEAVLGRIDAIVLEVNSNDAIRANSVKIVKGTPSSTPVKPTLIDSGNVHQHPLAYITVGAGTISITSANIENVIGTTDCPYISSLSGNGIPILSTPPTNPAITAYIDTSVPVSGGSLVDLIYPIGSIYMSVNTVNPATLFGGTWVQIKDKFLLAAGDSFANASTGGEANHTLTLSEIPSHRHQINSSGTAGSGTTSYGSVKLSLVSTVDYSEYIGGGQAHNNMPPYLAVNIWKRTA